MMSLEKKRTKQKKTKQNKNELSSHLKGLMLMNREPEEITKENKQKLKRAVLFLFKICVFQKKKTTEVIKKSIGQLCVCV